MWGKIKGEVARQNIGSSLEHKNTSKYSPEKLNKCWEHIRKIEDK